MRHKHLLSNIMSSLLALALLASTIHLGTNDDGSKVHNIVFFKKMSAKRAHLKATILVVEDGYQVTSWKKGVGSHKELQPQHKHTPDENEQPYRR